MTAAEYHKNEGEKELEFLWRIGEAKTSGLLEASWNEIAEVVNREYSKDETCNEGMYRRPYTAAKAFFEDVFSKMIYGDAEETDQIRVERNELLKERQRLRDERTQYAKYLRDEARFEQRLETIEQKWATHGKEVYVPTDPVMVKVAGKSEMLILLSDWHIGLEFDNEFGRFNLEVAKDRLQDLLFFVKLYQVTHECTTCNVAVLGDLISGNIHPSIMVANRENTIEQAMAASEMLAGFLYKLCSLFDEVNFVSVAGNHSRIEPSKDKAIKDERLDDLIAWYVKSVLKHMPNFKPRMVVDNTVAELDICGQLYYFVHGDRDELTQTGISKLSFMLGDIPRAVCAGHKHYPMYSEVNGITVMQNGSLCGTGDDHTLQHRLSGCASQTIAICNEDGIECYYPVRLDV